MKVLLFIVLALAAAYSGYWFIGARGVDRAVQNSLETLEAQGWNVTTGNIETRGFPSRFDITATDLTVTSPDGTLAYTAPWVQTVALSYRPNKVIAILPPEQTLTIQGQELKMSTDGLRASASVAANTALTFADLTAETKSLDVTSDLGWQLKTGAGLLALRPAGPAANTYEAYLGLADVMPQLGLASAPATPAQFAADATVRLDRPLDRSLVQAGRPKIEMVTLNSLDLTWGSLKLTGQGQVTVDAEGVPEGRITINADGWQDVIGLLAEAAIIDPDVLPTLTNMATMMSGGGGALVLPITFKSGFMSLGPLPLGPAPRLR